MSLVQYCLRLIMLLGLLPGVAQAMGTALDCDYSGIVYIYGSPGTIYVNPGTEVGDPVGSWMTIASPEAWRCRITNEYENDDVRGSIEGFSPYASTGTVNIDGETYTVFRTVVKAGLGYVARFRVTAAGFSTDWTSLSGGAGSGYKVTANPLLGPLPYNNGQGFPLGFEMQIHFVKTSTGLTSGNVAAFDPAYLYSYRTWNAGASSQSEVFRYRIVDYTLNTLNVQMMTQTCVTPDVSVSLPDVGAHEFTGPGTIKGLTSFTLQFTSCPGGLSGIGYKFGTTTAVLDAANGVAALDASSGAGGIGVLLRSATNDPITLNTEYPLADYDSSGNASYSVPLLAGIFQTESQVRSGSVKGTFTFTLIYK